MNYYYYYDKTMILTKQKFGCKGTSTLCHMTKIAWHKPRNAAKVDVTSLYTDFLANFIQFTKIRDKEDVLATCTASVVFCSAILVHQLCKWHIFGFE